MSATQITTALNSKANISDLNNYLPLNGGTLTGNFYGRPVVGSMATATGNDTVVLFASKDNTLLKGDTIDSNRYFILGCATDSTGQITNEHKYGQIQTSVLTDGTVRTQLIALKNVENNVDQAIISVGYTSSGNVFTTAPTPATTDNSATIATTAFVKAQNYITSSSNITGNSATSTKLATARNISVGNLDFTGSANFDGSGNITLNATPYYATITIGNTNNYPYHYIGTTDIITSSYIDKVINLLVTRDYVDGGSGIVRIEFRTNNASGGATGSCSVRWLCRDNNLPVDCIQVGFRNTAADSIADIFYKSAGTYNSAVVRVLSSGSRGNINRAFTLVNSSEVNNTTTSNKLTSVGAYKSIADAVADLHSGKTYTSTITASDNAVVQYANTVTGYTMDISTNNTTATWVPVLQGTIWQHRVIPADAKFTDTVTTVTTSGSGNAVTAITASNGALTVTKGSTAEIVSAKAIESTRGYIAYNSGLQICYGQMWGVDPGTTITYPRAFSTDPRVVVSRHYGAASMSSAGDQFVWVYSTGTTGFKVGSNGTIYGFYIAIGLK